MRHSMNVSFLNLSTDETPAFLHEAQISCVVTGSDDWRWVGYCIVEAYFDTVDKGKETVLAYHDDSLNSCEQPDPFTYGVTNINDSSSNPRQYFLTAFRCRLIQVKREWQRVLDKLDQGIRRYEQVGFPFSWRSSSHQNKSGQFVLAIAGVAFTWSLVLRSLGLSDVKQTGTHGLPSLKQNAPMEKAEAQDISTQESYKWVINVRMLSEKISQSLSETVDACDKFRQTHATYFQDLSVKDGCRDRSLYAIQTTIFELEYLKGRLKSISMRCDGFQQHVSLVQYCIMNV